MLQEIGEMYDKCEVSITCLKNHLVDGPRMNTGVSCRLYYKLGVRVLASAPNVPFNSW